MSYIYGKPFYYLLGNIDILFIFEISYILSKISNTIFKISHIIYKISNKGYKTYDIVYLILEFRYLI